MHVCSLYAQIAELHIALSLLNRCYSISSVTNSLENLTCLKTNMQRIIRIASAASVAVAKTKQLSNETDRRHTDVQFSHDYWGDCHSNLFVISAHFQPAEVKLNVNTIAHIDFRRLLSTWDSLPINFIDARQIFGRPWVKRFALCYQTVVSPVLSVCLAMCTVGVLWPNGLMDQDDTWQGRRPRTRRHCVG